MVEEQCWSSGSAGTKALLVSVTWLSPQLTVAWKRTCGQHVLMCCRGDISYTHVEHRGNTVLQPDGSAPEGEKRRKSSFSSPQQWTELAVVQGWDKWKYIRVEDEIILVWIWLGSLRKCWRWEYRQSFHLSYRRLAEQMAERSQKCFKYGTFFMCFFLNWKGTQRNFVCVSVCCRTPLSQFKHICQF